LAPNLGDHARAMVDGRRASYTYEHDGEQFFRHSPSVVQTDDG
jgi:hypothetical protein